MTGFSIISGNPSSDFCSPKTPVLFPLSRNKQLQVIPSHQALSLETTWEHLRLRQPKPHLRLPQRPPLLLLARTLLTRLLGLRGSQEVCAESAGRNDLQRLRSSLQTTHAPHLQVQTTLTPLLHRWVPLVSHKKQIKSVKSMPATFHPLRRRLPPLHPHNPANPHLKDRNKQQLHQHPHQHSRDPPREVPSDF